MKFLNFSVAFLSKFKSKHTLLLNGKFSFCRHQNYSLRSTSLFVSPYRCFTVTNQCKINSLSSNGGKLFQEIENEYAHKVMENLSCYSSSLLKCPLQSNYNTAETEEPSLHLNVIDTFAQVTLHNLSKGSSLEDIRFHDLIEKLCYALPETSDENIKKVLYYLCMWPKTSSVNTRNFKSLWQLLDEECMKRMNRWNVSQQLLIGDYWFHLKLSRISHYNSALIYNLLQNIDSLTNHQVVQLMFYINLQRELPLHLISKLEKKLESVINLLTLEELGIVCLGFFKTKSKISSVNLLQFIIKNLMHNVEKVDTTTVSAVLKFLRKSLNISLIEQYILTLHKCIPCIDNFDIPTSVHLALLSSQCNVYHPLLLNCVSDKLADNMDKARIKDCAKLLQCLSLYNHFEGKFHDVFIAELKKKERENEIIYHPKHFVHVMLYYSYMGHYDYELLAKLFKKEFIEESCIHSPDLKPNFAEIDYCVEIECPDYTGPKLDASKRKVLQDRRGNLPNKCQSQNMQSRLLNDIYGSLVEILGNKDNVLIRHILPHIYSPDIIVRLSGNMEKSLVDLCQDISTDFILKPPKDEVWAVFVVCGTYSFSYKSSHMTGIPSMKLRQLQKIGYHVTPIPYFNVSRNISRKKDFLREKLNMLEKNQAVM